MIPFLQIKDLNLKTITVILCFTIGLDSFANNTFPPSYEVFLAIDCDACGCSNNGGSLGMGGVLDNNFVGVRYLFQKYQSKDGIFIDSPKIDEFFNTVQVWSRIPIVNRLEVQAFVPFHFHTRKYTNKETAIKGLGDISIITNYTILNKKGSNYNEEKDKISSSTHLVKIGAGVKLPTGSYNEAINNSINPSFQLGTGSVDYITNLQYVYKYNSFGVTNYVNYYLKGANAKEYQFGNQFNFNSTFFYVFKDEKKHSFVPSLGISGEFYQANKQYKLSVKDTEGNIVFSSIGIEYNTEKITVGTSAMYPIHQNLAQGKINVKFKSTLYLNYNF